MLPCYVISIGMLMIRFTDNDVYFSNYHTKIWLCSKSKKELLCNYNYLGQRFLIFFINGTFDFFQLYNVYVRVHCVNRLFAIETTVVPSIKKKKMGIESKAGQINYFI